MSILPFQKMACWSIAAAARSDLICSGLIEEENNSVRYALVTLAANVSLRSTAFRHALRLAATMAVATAAWRVSGLPRGYWIPMTALLVLKPGQAATADEVAGFCQGRLAKYKCPKEIRFVDALPKSPVGKILRKELRGHARTQR